MNKHSILSHYVKLIINNENKLTNSLIIKGQYGLGKTHTVIKTLENVNLKENINYIYISGFITPVELFNTLDKYNTSLENPKLFIFDDLDGILREKKCVSLLKSALWGQNDVRKVSYQSSTSKINRSSFDFEGRIILIMNDKKQEGMFGKSLADRGINYEMNLSNKEMKEYIEGILPFISVKLEIREKVEVWNFVKRFIGHADFSIRTVIRGMILYKCNKDNWKELFVHTLDLDEKLKIFYSLDENKTDSEQQIEFSEKTGMSKRTFQRIKKDR